MTGNTTGKTSMLHVNLSGASSHFLAMSNKSLGPPNRDFKTGLGKNYVVVQKSCYLITGLPGHLVIIDGTRGPITLRCALTDL